MSGNNLFVMKNGMLAFTNYIFRDNRTLFKLPFVEMVILSSYSLAVPLGIPALSLLRVDSNDQGSSTDAQIGPQMVRIGPFGDITEAYVLTTGFKVMSFRAGEARHSPKERLWAEDQFYVRSPNWHIETAAMTACLIYDDVKTIFEEAYYAAGYTPPPYYVVSLRDLTNALLQMPLLVEMAIIKSRDDPKFDPNAKEHKDREYTRYLDPKKKAEDQTYLRNHPRIADRVKSAVLDIMKLEPVNQIFETKETKHVQQERTSTAKGRDPGAVQKPNRRNSKKKAEGKRLPVRVHGRAAKRSR